MKKTYVRIGLQLTMILLVYFGVVSCEEVPQSESTKEAVVDGSLDSEVYVKPVNIAGCECFLVYATCNGKPGHSVKECEKYHSIQHCFLRHSKACPCLKTRPAVSTAIDDDDEDSSDPFNW